MDEMPTLVKKQITDMYLDELVIELISNAKKLQQWQHARITPGSHHQVLCTVQEIYAAMMKIVTWLELSPDRTTDLLPRLLMAHSLAVDVVNIHKKENIL